MISFNKLQKSARKTLDLGKQYTFSILGDSSTQFLSQAIKGYAYESNINLSIFEADYDQIDIQVMDNKSDFYKFNSQYTLLYISSEKLYNSFLKLSNYERSCFAENTLQYIISIHNRIKEYCSTTILQFNFIEIQDNLFGNYSNSLNHTFIYQIRKLNYLFNEYVYETKNVFVVDISSLCNTYGYNMFFDAQIYYNTKMNLSLNILPYVAKSVIDVLSACIGKTRKCAILDLDNTLWGGVIGDDGISGIQLGEYGLGKIYYDIQMYFKELKNRGILLAVCSKNNEETAKEVFVNHPDMVLSLDDITLFVANWEDKASNIKYIQSVLNIGMDSLVFIDDNAFERELVKSVLPEVTVVDLPEDPAEYLSFIKSLNLFEAISYSKEDQERTQQYKSEAIRRDLQTKYTNIDDYLSSLNMMSKVSPFDEFNYNRIAQLTQRSNQFNLRTIRYTDEQIKSIANDKSNFITLYFTLEDKIGSHGIISVVILKILDKDNIFIDTWLMSCRVLKRGMEDFIVNKIVEICRDNHYKFIHAEYIPTSKNSMVKDIFSSYGFTKNDNNFVLDISEYDYKINHIKEIK